MLAQLAGTSLWFVPNAVMRELELSMQLDWSALGLLTSSVQFGFVLGTLTFAVLTIADRFSPSKVFFVCAISGAITNGLVGIFAASLPMVVVLRIATGFLIAGIYPIGMKIASDHFGPQLGRALGWLLGALVLGTAFPHLLKALTATLPWQTVVFTSSLLAIGGGLVVNAFIADGPYRKKSGAINPRLIFQLYKPKAVRQAAFGYFGHMWELYAFWAFVPVLLTWLNVRFNAELNVHAWSFLIIGSGAVSCIVGGVVSQKIGSRKVAFVALAISGLCCLLSPWWIGFGVAPALILLIAWGLSVMPDSPQFSSLVAQSSKPEHTGTALTFTNCIGFAITIVAIQMVNGFLGTNDGAFAMPGEGLRQFDVRYLGWFLVIGPVFGLVSMRLLRTL